MLPSWINKQSKLELCFLLRVVAPQFTAAKKKAECLTKDISATILMATQLSQ